MLVKHDITHDMRIKTKVVYGMLIWAFTFLRGARGEGDRAWENKVFLVCFSPFSVYLCSSKRKRRFEES